MDQNKQHAKDMNHAKDLIILIRNLVEHSQAKMHLVPVGRSVLEAKLYAHYLAPTNDEKWNDFREAFMLTLAEIDSFFYADDDILPERVKVFKAFRSKGFRLMLTSKRGMVTVSTDSGLFQLRRTAGPTELALNEEINAIVIEPDDVVPTERQIQEGNIRLPEQEEVILEEGLEVAVHNHIVAYLTRLDKMFPAHGRASLPMTLTPATIESDELLAFLKDLSSLMMAFYYDLAEDGASIPHRITALSQAGFDLVTSGQWYVPEFTTVITEKNIFRF